MFRLQLCGFRQPVVPPHRCVTGSFYPFVIYTAFATAVSAVFVIIPFLVAPSRVDLDKSSAYECGFDAFGEVRGSALVCVLYRPDKFATGICKLAGSLANLMLSI
jgi:hypothetical protein